MGPRGKPPKTAMTEAARKRWTLIAAIIGLNITILDETVVFLALPAINRDLHVGLNGQEWIVNAYLLSLSALLLLGGSLADVFGRRRVFLYGLGWNVAPRPIRIPSRLRITLESKT